MSTSRREILDDFLSYVGARGDDAARDRAERAINRAIARIWGRHPWRQFQSALPYTFTTTVGVRTYALPEYFGRVNNDQELIQNVTARSTLAPLTQEELLAMDGTALTTNETGGPPSNYVLAGVVGVSVQPATAGEALEVLSSDTLDVTVKALVEGLNGSGVYTRTQVTLTGQTAVALGTWQHVERFGKSYPASLTPTTELTSSAGTVTLRTVAAATTLQALLAEESTQEHPALTLYPIPNVAQLISVPVFRRPLRLRYDSDPIPMDWDAAIFERMLIEWRVMGGQKTVDDGIATPALTDLICLDNMNRPNTARTPYRG